jgi:hypothetical protein
MLHAIEPVRDDQFRKPIFVDLQTHTTVRIASLKNILISPVAIQFKYEVNGYKLITIIFR